MKKFYSLSIFLALFFSVLLVGHLEAATYYIDGSNGNDSNSGTIASPWKTISKANSALKAGDTVYIIAGTYASEQITPANSGTSGNYITYQNYNGETVTISGGSRQANLINKNWIKIDGINFYKSSSSWVYLSGSNYNIIQNCTFHVAKAYGGFNLFDNSTYNKILDNTFFDSPDAGNAQGTNPADHLRVRLGSTHNLFEGNTFNKTGHVSLFIQARYNVIRGNTIQNKYHTGLGPAIDGPTLIENNLFYDQGSDYLNDPIPATKRRHNPGIQCNDRYHIIRRNVFDNNGTALNMVPDGDDYTHADYNKIYHNTINKSIRCQYTSLGYPHQIVLGNIFKNNIFSNSFSYNGEPGYNIWFDTGGSTTNRWYANNAWGGTGYSIYNRFESANFSDIIKKYPTEFPSAPKPNLSVDPLYDDPDNRVFTLQQGSPMIDAGAWLTTITSATANGVTSFNVKDADYFYDGWTIPGETGDVIKTENGQTATILTINYDKNKITVSPAIDIVNGDGLALNYFGSAPDIGAYEYGITGASPAPPTELMLLVN